VGTVVHAVKDGSEAGAGAAAVESSILHANAGPAGLVNRLSVALLAKCTAVDIVVRLAKNGSEAVAGAAAVASRIHLASAGPAGPASRLSVALLAKYTAVDIVVCLVKGGSEAVAEDACLHRGGLWLFPRQRLMIHRRRVTPCHRHHLVTLAGRPNANHLALRRPQRAHAPRQRLRLPLKRRPYRVSARRNYS
jgi:hypothetical protein